jgi:hypothetical protein
VKRYTFPVALEPTILMRGVARVNNGLRGQASIIRYRHIIFPFTILIVRQKIRNRGGHNNLLPALNELREGVKNED